MNCTVSDQPSPPTAAAHQPTIAFRGLDPRVPPNAAQAANDPRIKSGGSARGVGSMEPCNG